VKSRVFRMTEQRANKDQSRIIPANEWFQIDHVSDHVLFRQCGLELPLLYSAL
jgi:hypothetical protein